MASDGRLPPIDEESLTSHQRVIYDQIKRTRGNVRGPFAIWLRSPAIAEHALGLQSKLQTEVSLPRHLLELMILVAARRATAQFAWFAHERHALSFGIAPEVVGDIKARRTPNFESEEERAVYDITNELITDHSLSETTYLRGMALFGEQVMVELVSAVGFYVMVAMTLNAFEAPVPGGTHPLE